MRLRVLALATVFAVLACSGSNSTDPGTTQTPAGQVRSISLDAGVSPLYLGSTRQIVANVTADANTSKAVKWSITPEDVATISSSGIVTPVASGTAVVTATSEATPAVSGTATIIVPAQIAFYSQVGKVNGLFVMNDDGSQVKQIADSVVGQGLGSISWSPDRKRILFARGPLIDVQLPDPINLYTVTPNGTALTKVTPGQGHNYSPTWAPDGKRIAFISTGFLGGPIQIMDVATGRIRALPVSGDHPAWSPDGSAIAFYSQPPSGLQSIFKTDTMGANVTQLPSQTGITQHPAWSPDGRSIVYYGDRHLWIVNADGSGAHRLTPFDQNDADLYPDWSPDGSLIIFSSTRNSTNGSVHFFVIKPDGTGMRQVGTVSEGYGAAWRK